MDPNDKQLKEEQREEKQEIAEQVAEEEEEAELYEMEDHDEPEKKIEMENTE